MLQNSLDRSVDEELVNCGTCALVASQPSQSIWTSSIFNLSFFLQAAFLVGDTNPKRTKKGKGMGIPVHTIEITFRSLTIT